MFLFMSFCKPAKKQQHFDSNDPLNCDDLGVCMFVGALKREIDSPHCDKWRLMNRIGHFSHIYPPYFYFLCIVFSLFWWTPYKPDKLNCNFVLHDDSYVLIDVFFFCSPNILIHKKTHTHILSLTHAIKQSKYHSQFNQHLNRDVSEFLCASMKMIDVCLHMTILVCVVVFVFVRECLHSQWNVFM